MQEQKRADAWEAVFIPKDSLSRKFTSEKSGKELCEIVLPEALPEGAPACGGWHFYMPAGCVHETKDEKTLRMTFPPSWKALRFLAPYVPGKRPEVLEFPVDDALALLRDTFNNR